MKSLLRFAKKSALVALPLLFIVQLSIAAAAPPQVSIISSKPQSVIFLHGLTKLTGALTAKHIPFEQVTSLSKAKGKTLIVAGLTSENGEIGSILKKYKTAPESEALSIHKSIYKNKPLWAIAGCDDKGAMYALLDVANRISWSTRQQPMRYVKEITQKPDVKERGISMYTMNRRYWESRFYDDNYWTTYFDMMAQDRLNMLEIMFGYENGGFMAPCYPYFFNVDGFPDVKIADITPEQQQRNLATMNHIIQIAHDRGIGVRLGIWDHMYRGGVQTGGNPDFAFKEGQPLPWQVSGLNAGNLKAYTKAAFDKFVKVIPNLDAVLFKDNNEGGLSDSELLEFGLNFLRTVKESAPNMLVDIHAKGLTDTLIHAATAMGVKFRIAPKYWMEQMGLPYHPTHINREDQKNRRHGYADMLTYPQHYQILWKLWNGGTNRVFLWGSPDYARRFAESAHLYNSSAYEVYEPLATKMESQWHDVKPFDLLNPQYQYYQYEFERYWNFYQMFGLIGYDPKTQTDVWDKEFEHRFGAKAAPIVESTLQQASWVLPRIVASCYPYSFFPTTAAWVEKQRLGDLPLYAKAEGSDIQQFASFDEEAQVLLGNLETAKTLPSTSSYWLAQTSATILEKVNEAEKAIGTKNNKEFNSTMVDMKMLANLALYHSRRVPAAVSYCLFLRTQDVSALDAAIAHEQQAIDAWQQLVNAAGNVYADRILIGRPGLSGHWRDELVALKAGLAKLQDQRKTFVANGPIKPAPHYKPATDADNSKYFAISHTPVTSAPVGKPIAINIKVTAPAGIKWVHLRYRSVNQTLDYQTLPMQATGQKDVYQVTIPADQINPKWDLMYLIELMDKNNKGFIYPDLNKETPYVIVNLKQ
ncbi:hypothetical protein C8P68_101935 [Mucilaginibacter yixingensis]|uniref:Glycosyl hydrolase family 67 n=1 Tax=Mucilaginibacter yixingensis TaxID=1295612 RepID=A0A2T5JH01_9SPHI|nr:hypothetical protein [Mucilaginibacter yixingensis]PTR01697.1 hypothetical protein C8P68_101935 [Mucilaginibacter yixingensis]